MTAEDLHNTLISYLQDAHAMEENVLRMLDSILASSSDDFSNEQFRAHRSETQRHAFLLEQRLSELGQGRSLVVEAPAIIGAWFKGMMDWVRPDKIGQNARDAYVTEHLEIASYSLLESLAERAGDAKTAALARQIRADEEAMAKWIDEHWDRFVGLTLQETR